MAIELVSTINELAEKHFVTPDGLICSSPNGERLVVVQNDKVDRNFGKINCRVTIDDRVHDWVQPDATVRTIASEISLIGMASLVCSVSIEKATLDNDTVVLTVLG